MIWLLIGYMFLFIHRPFEVWPVLGTLHVERVYMLGMLLVAAFHPGKRWLPNPQHWANLAFAAAVFLCWLLSPWADAGQQVVEDYFKIVVFYGLIVLTVHDERNLRRLVAGFLVIMTVYMLHSLWEYTNGRHQFRMGIARLIGVDTTLGNPNSFGNSIVYTLPLVAPLWLSRPTGRMKLFLLGYLGLSLLCIALTGSRSSFVGLVLWALIAVLRSHWRLRMGLLAIIAAPLLWAALPATLQTRFETIIDPNVGPANALESGQGRIEGLILGLELWARYPITGCGPGAFRPATGSAMEPHNLYGQLLGEMGTLGALAFLGVLVAFWVNLRRVKRVYQDNLEWERGFLYHLPRAIALGLLLLLFEGNFGHNLFRFNWLWYGGFLVVAQHCVRERWPRSTLGGLNQCCQARLDIKVSGHSHGARPMLPYPANPGLWDASTSG